MKSRKFTIDDLLAFAKLSGDYNPQHVDPVAARRSLFGSAVAHGIYSVLWGLDCWLEDINSNIELRSIKAMFPKPIRIGEEVNMLFDSNHHEKHLRIELYSNRTIASILEIEWAELERRNIDYPEAGFPDKDKPRVLSENELKTASGTLKLYLDIETSSKLFPHLSRCLSPLQIAVFLATSRLVGMECPGLHSIYSELKLIAGDVKNLNTLEYEVKKYDKRFDLISMNIMAPGMTGYIKAFIRPTHQEQATYLKLKEIVDKDEFAGQKALIIGGSRGLGEVTAKLLATGAAEVKITYYKGEEDALRVIKEITLNGGIAECFHLDVLSNEKNNLSMLLNNWVPTHLYYFATPFIFSGVKGIFSISLFNRFCDYYITGFLNIVEQLMRLGVRNFFYPSSVAIDELPLDMGEYAAAKIAGEMLCNFLKASNKDMSIYTPRLPRLSTDQTVSILPVKNQDTIEVMLKHLRLFRDMSI